MAGPDPIIERTRANRKNSTSAETRSLLRDRRLRHKFRRQHPIGLYAVDFACPAVHLPSHHDPEQGEFDQQRSEYLRLAGWEILGVPNERVYLSLGEVEVAIRGILEP